LVEKDDQDVPKATKETIIKLGLITPN